MATNKFLQGKQKRRDKFFTSPTKHTKVAIGEAKQKNSNSASNSFFIKNSDKAHSSIDHGSKLENNFYLRNTKKEKQLENNEKETLLKGIKKPFDKKKYRLQKYSKKYRVKQWEERRKKVVMREYHREIKDEPTKLNYEDLEQQIEERDEQMSGQIDNNINDDVVEKQLELDVKNKKRFRKPHEEFERVKEEKEKKQKDILKQKGEREEARRKAIKERAERSKKLSRKTKRGQPIMKYRMEMLLDKIQKSMNQ